MSDQFDEFSKSVAEQMPRRETLRRFGAVFAAAVLSPLGADAAVRRSIAVDPCKAFCKCRNTKQKNQCLAACKACNKDVSRLSGSCGSYVCCAPGQKSCDGYCTDVKTDFQNCGSCGYTCGEPDDYEYAACIEGKCEYWCVDGADYCDGYCTPLNEDYENCGACGNVCTGSTPYCNDGVCSQCLPGLVACGSACVDLYADHNNCGACGNVCSGATPYCIGGVCGNCPAGSTNCSGVCTNIAFDTRNCGGCGIVCQAGETCSGGICQSAW